MSWEFSAFRPTVLKPREESSGSSTQHRSRYAIASGRRMHGRGSECLSGSEFLPDWQQPSP